MSSFTFPVRFSGLAIVLLYGIFAAVVLMLFQIGRDFFIMALHRTDLWISAVSVVFIITGYLLGRRPLKTITDTNLKETDPLGLLSKRELEVLDYLLRDMSNKEICAIMFIEKSTLKTHVNHIYKKLKVQNRTELLALYRASSLRVAQL